MGGKVQIEIPKEKVAAFCQKWKIAEAWLFGSALREDFKPGSDVDVLVRFAPGSKWRFHDLMDMEEELAAILGRKVDLVERESVEGSPNYIRRKHILSSLEPLYGEDEAYLLDMLLAAKEIRGFAQGKSPEEFRQDRLFQLAVMRLIQNAGEAARKISPEFKAAHLSERCRCM